MNAGADVNSLAVLHDWYATMTQFRTEAGNILASLGLALQREADWLGEQEQHWRRQIRTCEEDVTQAMAELRTRRYSTFDGRPPDCSVQEKALRRAKANLEFAEDQLEVVRRWMKRLPMEICDTYNGPTRHLSFFLDGELERGLALLARQLTALDQYANLRSAVAPTKEKS